MAGVAKIGILTSGGDAPGMNAAVRAATMLAQIHGLEVVGIRRGYRGILERDFCKLAPSEVEHLFREGGTVLHSTRCLEFHETAVRQNAREILSEEGIDGLIIIGGNGSLTGAMALSDPEEGGALCPKVIGIPASIDNDMAMTSMSIGVDTAVNTIVEACDKISDTASAHRRTFIVEVMGRSCGYLAMAAGIASGADLVLFPEAGKSDEELARASVKAIVGKRQRGGAASTLILKAEGVELSTAALKEKVDEILRAEHGIEESQTRVTVLGHVVRGGRPSSFDRLLGTRLANVAVQALIAGETRKMASWMPPGDVPEVLGARTPWDPYCWLVDLKAALQATENLLRGESPLAQWRSRALEGLEAFSMLGAKPS